MDLYIDCNLYLAVSPSNDTTFSENNIADDGESSYATVMEDKKQEFAYKVVEMLLSEADQHTGCPYWGIALDEVFLNIIENAEDDILNYMEDLDDE